MKVYRLFNVSCGGGPAVFDTLDEAVEYMVEDFKAGECEVGDSFRIDIAEMAEETFKTLPEFQGW